MVVVPIIRQCQCREMLSHVVATASSGIAIDGGVRSEMTIHARFAEFIRSAAAAPARCMTHAPRTASMCCICAAS